MFVLYKSAVVKLFVGLIKIAAVAAVSVYALPYLERALETEFERFYRYLPWALGAAVIWVIVRFIWGLIVAYPSEGGLPQFSNAVNGNVRYPLSDEQDALLVKMSSLLDITNTSNSRVEGSRAYINSREAYDAHIALNKDGIRESSAWDYLVLSYDIHERSELLNAVSTLLDSLPAVNNPTSKGTFDKAVATIDQFAAASGATLDTAHPDAIPGVAFNLQRAAMLVRWGFTCNMLEQNEWDAFKQQIWDAYQLYFAADGFDKFIYDYLIAVHDFHADDSLSMVRERLFGIAELQKNHFLTFTWQEINAIARA